MPPSSSLWQFELRRMTSSQGPAVNMLCDTQHVWSACSLHAARHVPAGGAGSAAGAAAGQRRGAAGTQPPSSPPPPPAQPTGRGSRFVPWSTAALTCTISICISDC